MLYSTTVSAGDTIRRRARRISLGAKLRGEIMQHETHAISCSTEEPSGTGAVCRAGMRRCCHPIDTSAPCGHGEKTN